MNSNPLQKYFRQPVVYIRLPSNGKFYPPNALEPTPNGEYPVLPMTTMDEITYRTPDALFNGNAVASVIESCLPNIKNAWNMPGLDIDSVLIAIRIATFGAEMDIGSTCPACDTEGEFTVDLRKILDQMGTADYSKPLVIGDLEIYFRPMSYRQINENSMEQFQEQKLLQVTAENLESVDQDQLAKMGQLLKKLTEVTTKALSQNIAMVKTPQAQVTQSEHITEWLLNCDRATFTRIRDHVIAVKSNAEIKPLDMKCSNCGHEYKQLLTLDQSNFFGVAS